MADSPGLRYLTQLLMGSDELQWLQYELNQLRRRIALGHLIEPGWVGEPVGADGLQAFGWRLQGRFDGTVDVLGPAEPGVSRWARRTTPLFYGIAPDGEILIIRPDAGPLLDAAGAPLTVPADGVIRTIVARPVLSRQLPGTVAVTAGSGTIAGTGTDFTRFTAGGDLPSQFRISSGPNAGTYTVQSVTDATTAVVTPVFSSSETGMRLIPIGRFLTPQVDVDIHHHLDVAYALEARTVTPPSDGLIVADARKASEDGIAVVIDRRWANVAREVSGRRPHARWHLLPDLEIAATALPVTGATQQDQGPAVCVVNTSDSRTTTEVTLVATTPSRVGNANSGILQLSCAVSGGTWRIQARERVIENLFGESAATAYPDYPWRDPGDAGSDVNIVSGQSGVCNGLAVVKVASLLSDRTHLAFYVDDAFNVVQARTVNHGETWIADGTIWAAPGGSPTQGLTAILTRESRIVLVRPTDNDTLAYIYSDDYGATWSTNGGAGFVYYEAPSGQVTWPSLAQDANGRLWTAFEVGPGPGTIALLKAAALLDPTPASDVPSTGWTVSPQPFNFGTGAEAPTSWSRPVLLPMPDGQMLCFLAGLNSSDFVELGCSYVTEPNVTKYQTLQRIADGTPTDHPGLAVVQVPNGLVYVTYGDLDALVYRESRWVPVPAGLVPQTDYFGQ